MDDEQFNMELRKFLKRFGISAQREIENVVRSRGAAGALAGQTHVTVRARLEIDGHEAEMVVEERLPLPPAG